MNSATSIWLKIIGSRFDEGNESIRDAKEMRLQTSIDLMVDRQNRMLGATLAIFSFQYGSDGKPLTGLF